MTMPTPRIAACRRAVVSLGLGLGLAIAATVAVPGSPLRPLPALAQDAALAPGEVAIVGNTGGEGVSLREGPGYDASILGVYGDGSVVDLFDGPIYAEDGSVWFGVSIDGLDGYMAADYLLPTGTTTSITTDDGIAGGSGSGPQAGRAGESDTSAVPGTIITNVSPEGSTTINADGVDDASYDTGAQRSRQQAAPVTDDASGADGQTSEAQYIAEQPAADASAVITDPYAIPAGQPAAVADVVNLRAAPAPEAEVLRVLPPGSEVVVTGEPTYGWTPVWYNGTDGFVAAQYLVPAGATDAAAASDPGMIETEQLAIRSGAAFVVEDAELKANPSPNADAIDWIPAGSTVTPSGGPRQGFYEVAWNGQTGWVSGAFLAFEGERQRREQPPLPPPASSNGNGGGNGGGEAGVSAPAAFAGLAWPVQGGAWSILQGYNGTSHINRDDEWQYRYSIDIVREDGRTAGENVYAPAPGVVRWTQTATGGVSIDLGNGHAIAMFHVTLGDHLKDGEPLDQGEWIGTISGPGGMGFVASPHLHIALWETNDGGNWDRRAKPFTGDWAFPGLDLPDIGGTQQHTGIGFRP